MNLEIIPPTVEEAPSRLHLSLVTSGAPSPAVSPALCPSDLNDAIHSKLNLKTPTLELSSPVAEEEHDQGSENAVVCETTRNSEIKWDK